MSNSVRRARPLLGTLVEIGVGGRSRCAEAAIDAAFASMRQVEKLLSFQDPCSELSRINRRACGEEVPVHPLTVRVLQLALRMGRLSGELFNCTVGGALVRSGILPDHGAAALCDTATSADVRICGNRVRLTRPLRITLDGIAKGYAVDHGVAALRRHRIDSGWINAGGDLRAFGALSLPIAVRDHDARSRPLGFLQNAALATSETRPQPNPGDNAFLVGTGAATVPATWTAMARFAWRADALTKVAALAAPRERRTLVERCGGILVSDGHAHP
jgi:thiamine biosynthesis lipoprotein